MVCGLVRHFNYSLNVSTRSNSFVLLDMNEPASFGTDSSDPWYWNSPDYPTKAKVPALQCPMTNSYDDPPYPTQAALFWGPGTPISDKTICMIGVQGETSQYKHYDVHNLFGWSESIPTQAAVRTVTNKRGIVLGRSTFPSSGKFTGHWLGDNNSDYADLRTSIIGMMEFNMFGIPYIGADICGFNGNTTEDLCARWMQLGAFYPMCRNHNSKGTIPQDPGQWPLVASTSAAALNFRYLNLPYLYTLFYKAHTKGEMVVRPLFFDFPSDNRTWTLDHQFMWGPAFTVVAALDEGNDSPLVYIPGGAWYSLMNSTEMVYGRKYSPGFGNCQLEYNTTLPTFVRGGYIVPQQEVALNTTSSRMNPFQLLVAVSEDNTAYGEMFWDDGESINLVNYAISEFTLKINETGGHLIINTTFFGNFTESDMPNYFSSLTTIGLPKPDISSFKVNDVKPTGDSGTTYISDSNESSVWIYQGERLIPVSYAEVTWLNAS